MTRVPAAAFVTAGLVGGFAVARYTGRRELGGAAFAVCGGLAARTALPVAGPAKTGAIAAIYVAAMGGSHALAKKLGAWPSVAAVTAVASGTAYALADRPLTR